MIKFDVIKNKIKPPIVYIFSGFHLKLAVEFQELQGIIASQN